MHEHNPYAKLYRRRFPHGERLNEMKRIIKWDLFRPILNGLFKDTDVGRPHEDVVLMARMLVLQSWYSLSDEQLEIQCGDRLTFQNFLSYPDKVPDARTIWLFRERMASTGADREFWEELNSQLKDVGVGVREGKAKEVMFVELGGIGEPSGPVVEVSRDTAHLQDSTMLEADPGAPTVGDIIRRKDGEAKKEERKGEAKKGTTAGTSIALTYDELKKSKERGDEANTRRSRDGTWAVKRGKSYFGYKLHTKVLAVKGMIEDYEVTTASLHDSQLDLSLPYGRADDQGQGL